MSSKLISCFLILIITSSFAGCAEDKIPPTPVRPVRAIMLGDTLAAEGRSFPGRAKATEEVNLSFRVNGELTSLPINVGDIVKKGDVLASLDKKDYEAALERAQAESMLAKAELDAMRIARPEEIRRIEAELREAQAVLDLTAAELVRNEELFKKTVLSKSEIDRSRAARDRSAALRDQAKESLTIAKKGARKEDIDAKEAEIKALESEVTVARNNLEYTNLVAPFSGSIVAKYVENYQNVAAKRVICRLLDTTKIEMIVNIPESKISQISNVTDIACTFDAFPGRKVPAKVKEVGTEASSTTRTYPVTLIMDQLPDIKILPGMAGTVFGRGKKLKEESAKGIIVPASAIFTPTTEKQSYVWILDEKAQTVSQKPVDVGPPTIGGIRLTGDLSPGQWVVTAGVHSLTEGQQVKLLSGGKE